MAKMTKTAIDKALRETVFDMIFSTGNMEQDAQLKAYFHKINDRQYGIILCAPPDGTKRYCRLGVIVAEEREDMTAEELMASEIEEYKMKQEAKAEKAQKRAAKAERDKARREKAKAEET